MSTDEYVPDEEDMEVAWTEFEASAKELDAATAEFRRGLARVRRDAAREALDGLADQFNNWAEPAAEESARIYRDTHYPIPEETP